MSLQNLQQKFFSDPDWKQVEDMLAGFVNKLVDPAALDWSQTATQFKAELRAKYKLYEEVSTFLQQTGIISRPIGDVKKHNIFK